MPSMSWVDTKPKRKWKDCCYPLNGNVLDNQNWTILPDLKHGHRKSAAVEVNGVIYIIDGFDRTGIVDCIWTSVFEANKNSDVNSSNNHLQQSPLITPCCVHAAVVSSMY